MEPAVPELKPLDPAIRKVWTIHFAGLSALAVLAALIYDLVNFLGDDSGLLPPGLLTVLVLAAGTAVALSVPRMRYRFWRYALLTEELYLERGVFNRVRTIVPLRRIQHLDVSQTLLEREFGLGKLIVHTAGSRSSDVVLPGLPHQEAERLRDEVKHFILEDTV
jgi:uncharacterized protein